jgi:protein SCO1/2
VTRGFVFLLAGVLAAGIGSLSWATDGFRVVTTDGHHRLVVEGSAQHLPDAVMIDQSGQPFSLADYRNKTVLVDFIYTRCPTICGVLGDDFRNLLALARPKAEIELLSIRFDPENDDREALQLYAERYGAAVPQWRVAAPASGRDQADLLSGFGVVVIPDGFGGFVHTSAVYVVDSQRRLTRILDPAEAPSVLMAMLREAGR